MFYSYAVAIGIMAALMAFWVAIQMAWRRTFPDASGDEDVMAGRAGCKGCAEDPHCARGGKT